MDNPAPRVSVIIPAYNHAPWIAQALSSVFDQTLTDWELIIIDDASSDDTWAIIEKTCAAVAVSQPGRISLIRHGENQGAPATLNEGLALARGEYIAILNSDDVWHAKRLQHLCAHSQHTGCDFVASAITLWDKHSQLKNHSEPHWLAWYEMLQADWRQHKDFLHTLLLGNFLITTSNFFFRRNLYERCGGFAELRYLHDYEFALRAYQCGARMACCWDEVLLHYRLHDDNTIRERPLAAQQENMTLLLEQLTELAPHLNAKRLHALRWQLAEIFRYYSEEWQTEIHRRLVAKETELFRLVVDRDAWVAERDEVIAEQQQMAVQHTHWLAERDALLASHAETISQQQHWIGQRDSWISARDAMISQRDDWVEQRDHWIEERDAWVLERDQVINHLRAEHEQLLSSYAFRFGNALLHPLRLLASRLNLQKWSLRRA